MRKTYPTDLSDTEWARLKTRLPDAMLPGRLRAHSLRDIFDAIFYVLRSGCPWRMLPGDFPPWSTVYYHFRRFRLSGLWQHVVILRAAERKRNGKDPNPSAAIMDTQSIKTTEEGGRSSGYDAHKNVKGRKRHLLVDTLGLPLSVYVTPADVQDRAGARLLLAGLKPLLPRLKKIWADGAYSGEELAKWCEEQGEWELEIVERDKKAKGFKVVSKRWIIERTLGWLRWDRRLAKDYERKVQTSETLVKVSMIRLMLKRLARGA
jgi:putative transposase